MPEFVLNRNYVLTGAGHRIQFLKGQPTYIPNALVREAASIGAERVDGPQPDALPAEEPTPQQLTAEQRQSELVAAIEMIVERNNPNDFGADGRPSVIALNKIVSFDNPPINKREVGTAWQAYKAKKEAE